MATAPVLRFRDLAIGQTFDFVDDSRPGYNSFFGRVRKITSRSYVLASFDTTAYSPNRYRSSDVMRVGSINARVFHVEAAS